MRNRLSFFVILIVFSCVCYSIIIMLIGVLKSSELGEKHEASILSSVYYKSKEKQIVGLVEEVTPQKIYIVHIVASRRTKEPVAMLLNGDYLPKCKAFYDSRNISVVEVSEMQAICKRESSKGNSPA